MFRYAVDDTDNPELTFKLLQQPKKSSDLLSRPCLIWRKCRESDAGIHSFYCLRWARSGINPFMLLRYIDDIAQHLIDAESACW